MLHQMAMFNICTAPSDKGPDGENISGIAVTPRPLSQLVQAHAITAESIIRFFHKCKHFIYYGF